MFDPTKTREQRLAHLQKKLQEARRAVGYHSFMEMEHRTYGEHAQRAVDQLTHQIESFTETQDA
jgi:hypothetical protein